jgi:hypothetical protein
MLTALTLALLTGAPDAPTDEPEAVTPTRAPLVAPGQPPASPARPSSTPASPAPAPAGPSDAPRMRVRLVEPSPSPRRLELVRAADDGPVCAVPCEVDVTFPDDEFYVTGPGTTASSRFRLTAMANHGRAHLTVTAGDQVLWGLSLAATIVGGLAMGAGVPLAAVGWARRLDVFTASGVATFLTGGLLVVLGVPGLLNNATIVQRTRDD